jgi:acetyl-CoA acetyltransferase
VTTEDESPREDTSLEALSDLRPVFKEGGTVTAGNSSPMSDGAAGVVIATQEWATAQSAEPMARIVASAVAGVHPDVMGIGPVPAVHKVLARAGVGIADIDLVELNEAFAPQSIACIRSVSIPRS